MITVERTLETFKSKRIELSGSIGLIPTMGNLHQGHLELIKAAAKENESIIVTIFVNPKQFGPNEDFDKYPRTLEQDVEKIKELGLKNQILIFSPDSPREMYPSGFATSIEVEGITDKLCGAKRPGHFKGVTTVVYKIFSLVKANKAYFGQKDYQQVQVISRMVEDLDLPVEIVMCPIIREESGLALSSRNQYLSDTQRDQALHLNTTLNKIKTELQNMTWVDGLGKINVILEEELKNENWDYLEVLDAKDLKEVSSDTNRVVIAGAYFQGSTRLIDNLLVDINYA